MFHKQGFFDGVFEATGGFGNVEYGAAGTVFIEQGGNKIARGKRSLFVDNKKRAPATTRVNQVSDYECQSSK